MSAQFEQFVCVDRCGGVSTCGPLLLPSCPPVLWPQVACHQSPVTSHLSPVTCHLSPVTCLSLNGLLPLAPTGFSQCKVNVLEQELSRRGSGSRSGIRSLYFWTTLRNFFSPSPHKLPTSTVRNILNIARHFSHHKYLQL